MTQAELLAQRDALIVARSSGHLEVEFYSGGTRRRVTYRSVKEIQAAIDAIDRDLAANAGTRVTAFLPYFEKGI